MDNTNGIKRKYETFNNIFRCDYDSIAILFDDGSIHVINLSYIAFYDPKTEKAYINKDKLNKVIKESRGILSVSTDNKTKLKVLDNNTLLCNHKDIINKNEFNLGISLVQRLNLEKRIGKRGIINTDNIELYLLMYGDNIVNNITVETQCMFIDCTSDTIEITLRID